MEGWIAVTHGDWFDFLAQQPRRDEVNFWSPSDYYAFHGTPGAPFFFKLKAPRNAIGGCSRVSMPPACGSPVRAVRSDLGSQLRAKYVRLAIVKVAPVQRP